MVHRLEHALAVVEQMDVVGRPFDEVEVLLHDQKGAAGRNPIVTAPITGPASPVRPPTAVQMTSSADSRNPTACGVTIP